MANEISLTFELRFAKGSSRDGIAFGPATFTFTGILHSHKQQIVGTAAEALDLGDITAGGLLAIINRYATNYVQIRGAIGQTPLVRLRAGEGAVFRLDNTATAPTVQANTAAVTIEYLLLEA